MIRRLNILYRVAVLAAVVAVAGCDKFGSSNSDENAQRQEEQRLQDQKERAALVERMKAAAKAQEDKQEPIKRLQKQIDALDQQISDAHARGKDWRALEK